MVTIEDIEDEATKQNIRNRISSRLREINKTLKPLLDENNRKPTSSEYKLINEASELNLIRMNMTKVPSNMMPKKSKSVNLSKKSKSVTVRVSSKVSPKKVSPKKVSPEKVSPILKKMKKCSGGYVVDTSAPFDNRPVSDFELRIFEKRKEIINRNVDEINKLVDIISQNKATKIDNEESQRVVRRCKFLVSQVDGEYKAFERSRLKLKSNSN